MFITALSRSNCKAGFLFLSQRDSLVRVRVFATHVIAPCPYGLSSVLSPGTRCWWSRFCLMSVVPMPPSTVVHAYPAPLRSADRSARGLSSASMRNSECKIRRNSYCVCMHVGPTDIETLFVLHRAQLTFRRLFLCNKSDKKRT